MNFIQQLDQLSEDEDDYDLSRQSVSFSLSNRYSALNRHDIFNNTRYKQTDHFQFQGIKSFDLPDSNYTEDADQQHNSTIKAKESPDLANTSSHHVHHHSIIDRSNELLSTNILADKTRSIFHFTHFNPMQSKCFEKIYHQDHNCVVSSPTGSGKTVLFELAILRLLNTQGKTNNIKILYIAPTKALCIERQNDWNNKFSTFGLTVGTLTSDTGFLESDRVKKANIIITTPEKWDLMTRKWGDYTKLFDLIKLLLIDEVHILREDRGSTLEVVVTRMKKICESIRIIALSATVPNIHDVSSWVKLSSKSKLNAITLVFGEEYRPVKLAKRVFGYRQSSNDWVFDSVLNRHLLDILNEFNNNSKPVLIFCPTRNSTMSTANYISTNYHGLLNNQAAVKAHDKDLQEYSRNGISFHHAGLSLEDRSTVEQNFINGKIKILCCTTTLAVGVNLPAYLVIIKGTKVWNLNKFKEYSELDVLQMMGRAGRPQFEKEALAVVMTSSDKQSHYENFVKGNEKLESKLHLNFHENVMSETYLKTIKSLEEAVSWLKHTFFYSRFKSNPNAYNEIPYNNQLGTDERLMKFCESKINELISFNLMKLSGCEYVSTPYGEAMTRHYILFDTMKLFLKAPKTRTLHDILLLISRAKEFETVRIKRTEKKLFKEINESPNMKYPLKPLKSGDSKKKITKTIDQNFEKIYLLIQYELGGLEFPGDPQLMKLQQSFKQDKFYVFKHVGRLLRCLQDCFIEKKDYVSLVNCLKLARCISASCWEDTPMVLKQLDNIGFVTVRRFASHKIQSFKQLLNLQSNKIEYYGSLRPGQGEKILSQLGCIPKFKIGCSVVKAYRSKTEPNSVVVKVNLIIDSQCRTVRWNNKPMNVIVVSGLSDGNLVDFRRAPFHKMQGEKSFGLEFLVHEKGLRYTGSISCEEIAGLQESFNLDLNTVLESKLINHLLENTINKSDTTLKSYRTIPDQPYSDMDSDSELDDFVRNLPISKVPETTPSKKRPHGKLTCKHMCKDKTKYVFGTVSFFEIILTIIFNSCRHLCCREGLATPVSKRNKHTNQEVTHSKHPVVAEKVTRNQSTKLDVIQRLSWAQSNKLNLRSKCFANKNKSVNLSEFIYHESHSLEDLCLNEKKKIRIEKLEDSDLDSEFDDEILQKLKNRDGYLGKGSVIRDLSHEPHPEPKITIFASDKIEYMKETCQSNLNSLKSKPETNFFFLDDSFISEEGFEEGMDFTKLNTLKNKPLLVRVKEKTKSCTRDILMCEAQKVASNTKILFEGSIIEISDDGLPNPHTARHRLDSKQSCCNTSDTTKSAIIEETSVTNHTQTSLNQHANDSRLKHIQEIPNKMKCVITDERNSEASEFDEYIYGSKHRNEAEDLIKENLTEITEQISLVNAQNREPINLQQNSKPSLLESQCMYLGSDMNSMFGSDVEFV